MVIGVKTFDHFFINNFDEYPLIQPILYWLVVYLKDYSKYHIVFADPLLASSILTHPNIKSFLFH
jgi:hypothetical protein